MYRLIHNLKSRNKTLDIDKKNCYIMQMHKINLTKGKAMPEKIRIRFTNKLGINCNVMVQHLATKRTNFYQTLNDAVIHNNLVITDFEFSKKGRKDYIILQNYED